MATNNCPTTTVTINIDAVNDCQIGEDYNYTVNEGELLTANGLAGNPEGVILRNDGNYSGNDYTAVVTLAWSGNELQFSCNNGNYYSTIECELGSPNDSSSNGWNPTWGTSW